MLIIPEQETVIIMPPRTGSTSIHAAIMEACPLSFMLYRHAERDAIPPGFENFRVLGFVRHPLARMWSLYKFLACLDPIGSASWAQEDVMRLLESVQGRPFEDWLLNNTELFLPDNTGYPGLYQKYRVPETRKSQFQYLRPDLGVSILPYSTLGAWLERHKLPTLHLNSTPQKMGMPGLSLKIAAHLEQYMGWEMNLGLELE